MQNRKTQNLKIIPLGGVREIGKNITVVEYKNEIIIIDCGLTFPDDEMLGIDIVIPDFKYLVDNKEKIKGLFITHGHEDHIGGIPYLLKKIDIPVYGTKLTVGLLENKLKEHHLSRKNLHTVQAGDIIQAGVFGVEFIRSSHSIPDSCMIAIKTPKGTVLFTGDFKIDYTPIDGQLLDMQRLGELGKEGVLALLSDSTNAERPGYTMSERTVGETFKNVFGSAKARIIVATFASNVHRIQQVITAAEYYHKKVALSGRSMENTVRVAKELGYLKLRENTLIDLEEIDSFRPSQVVLLTTGSQGEPMSALTRIANGQHRKVKLSQSDLVVLSATPIPGNEITVFSIINHLMEKGVKVIYQSLADVHVSGHACQEELKLIHALVKPKYFLPVHGEYRHLERHRELAISMGMREDHVFIGHNGDVMEINNRGVQVNQTVTAGAVMVDGLGIGDVGEVVLRDRKILSEDGMIIAMITVNRSTKVIDSNADLISRGFVYVKESEDLMDGAKKEIQKVLERCQSKNIFDWATIKLEVRTVLRKYIYRTTKRDPMIIPIIIDA